MQYYQTICGGKNPAEMSRQELFDAVVTHLRRQKKQAIRDGVCLYQAPDGCRCAIGALLPDSMAKEIPNGGVYDLVFENLEFTDWLGVRPDLETGDCRRLSFLISLQNLHDYGNWLRHDGGVNEKIFVSFANQYRLTYTPPVETAPA